jgi:hypothetical protein
MVGSGGSCPDDSGAGTDCSSATSVARRFDRPSDSSGAGAYACYAHALASRAGRLHFIAFLFLFPAGLTGSPRRNSGHGKAA